MVGDVAAAAAAAAAAAVNVDEEEVDGLTLGLRVNKQIIPQQQQQVRAVTIHMAVMTQNAN